ncbi:GNAT family N-acetyltransferase [Parvibaculaceae bacterium PLY_AMNH_Bact1]|nr:GNAT family N-acetyltransferase [Parvibaculaceae bacterium PLY_AMNH_Bact1]
MSFRIRAIETEDRPLIEGALKKAWGSVRVVSRGKLWNPLDLPGFVAESAGDLVGLVTYRHEVDATEVVTLDSFTEREGVGTALLQAVAEVARDQGKAHLWLITTNDNIPAIRFYQRRGWDMVALHHGALAHSRRHKPEIPTHGLDGVPIDHEIEFRLAL